MDASEARKIQQASLSGPAIEKFVTAIELQIAIRAEQGESKLVNPFSKIEGVPTENQKKAIKKYFSGVGFDWTEHPVDMDSRDPREQSWTEISW